MAEEGTLSFGEWSPPMIPLRSPVLFRLCVFLAVFGRDFADDPRGIACNEGIRRNVADDHRAGRDDRMI